MIPDPGRRADHRLLDDVALEASSVVANNTMNRERGLSGANSYAKELGFDPSVLLGARAGAGAGGAAWLDLCCGSGRALFHAAARFAAEQREADVAIVGVDLVDFFTAGVRPPGLELVTASVSRWEPDRAFDLITCVHGLHYVGDKLGLLARAVSWLAPDGLLVADFDAGSVRHADGRPAEREVIAALKSAGIDYDARRKRVRCRGARTLRSPAEYLGADDLAGPGYTRQPAVDSYYAWAQPDLERIEAWFAALVAGKVSRDDADRWARDWTADDDLVWDDTSWWALNLLHGVDLPDGQGGYLHDDEQVRGWLMELRSRRGGGEAG